jgi:Holliday junction resolvase RusA-like endonuclease
LSIALGAQLIFRLPWPNKHFINSRRDCGISRDNALKLYFVGKVDLDSLVKFTLGAIGGVAFVDDAQISKLTISNF